MVETGKRYMLLHGEDGNPKRHCGPFTSDVNLGIPVTILRRQLEDLCEEVMYEVEYVSSGGHNVIGYAPESSLGEEVMHRTIEVGKKYILIHGDDEGPVWHQSPTTYAIDLSQPVTVIRERLIHEDGSHRWEISFTSTGGDEYNGFASDRSFGKEVK